MANATSPIHPDFVDKFDADFVAFYNATLADKPGLHEIPWDPALRDGPPIPGASKPQQVGAIKDIRLPNCNARVFFPTSRTEETKLPVLLYFHGGMCITVLS